MVAGSSSFLNKIFCRYDCYGLLRLLMVDIDSVFKQHGERSPFQADFAYREGTILQLSLPQMNIEFRDRLLLDENVNFQFCSLACIT